MTTQICPTCHGQGWLADQRDAWHACPTCHGRGVAVWWSGSWWSWEHPINDLSILERRLERMVTVLISALLFIFVLLGLLIGGQHLLVAFTNGQLLSTLLERSGPMAVWWIGLLAAMFLTFRLERDATMRSVIPLDQASSANGDPWSGTISDVGKITNEATLRVLERAWRLAQSSGQPEVTPAHLLMVLSSTTDVGSMLVRMSVNMDQLRQRLQAVIRQPKTEVTTPLFSGAVRQVIMTAFSAAAKDERTLITPPYLLSGIAALDDPARDVLFDLGVDERKLGHMIGWLIAQEKLRRRMREFVSRTASKPRGAIDRGYTAVATPILNRYSHDLTAAARDGALPYVVGRERDIETVFRIMTSGRSVILVGDPGVGVSNVMAAVAERMAAEDVPGLLQDKRLVELSAANLVAGAGGVGEVEERVQTIIDEIARAGNIVLAIDHIDHLVGVSSTGSGLDAAQMLAQAISQRLFQVVATATIADYRRTVERGTLSSALEKVEITELDPESALAVLETRLGSLEQKYGIFFTFDALDQAVTLAHRYIHERPLPGTALELLDEAAASVRHGQGKNTLVTGPDVAAIVSERTKIAVAEVTAGEQEKLLHLEEEFHRRVVGQDEAVKAVANALRRARAELRDTRRPIANLLFLGPTGVGKTELAKTVAAVYFGSEDSMIRLDMSEYQELSSISRLIGAPAGYAGAEGGGVFTEAIRHQPYTLVLLDELEKAHPDILNLFLQVMDDGRITDASGRTIDCTNIILIATSNAGTAHIQDRLRQGARLDTIKDELINGELGRYFRPEFLNRFDQIVVFSPLGPLEVAKITQLMINQIADRLKAKGITLQASPEAVAELAERGFDPLFGARPLRRVVQEQVDNALAQFLLQGKLNRRDVAVLEPGGTISIQTAQHPS